MTPTLEDMKATAAKLIDEIEDGDGAYCTDETIDLIQNLLEYAECHTAPES